MILPQIAEHWGSLMRSPRAVCEEHRGAASALARWIADRLPTGDPIAIVIVCTGNSRRSMLGAALGNCAAALAGSPQVRFFSAGTAPSAFNPRSVAALRRIGLIIEPSGELAEPGAGGEPNPRYSVRWGDESSERMIEFSKALGDPTLPRSDFAAAMVCDEADAGCPTVVGASLRIPLPFADPKAFDGTIEEAPRYDETRDALGRTMIEVFRMVKEARESGCS